MAGLKLFALGIDIGGTNTKLGIVDENGNVSRFVSFPTQAKGPSPEPFLHNLSSHLNQIFSGELLELIGIGVCSHGYIDDEGCGPIICESTPALRGLNLYHWLYERYRLPVQISNDLAAHALAEYHFGVGRGTRRFMAMALGTGIGAGVVVKGKALRFVGGTTGDTGRVILDPAGPKCIYQVHGSAEALCGTAYIEAQAEMRYGKKLPAMQVIKAAREGSDPIAIEIIHEVGEHVGWALASLCSIFLPDKVALTGGTAEAGEVLLLACRKKFTELVGEYHHILIDRSQGYYQGVEIILSHYGEESGVVGAVAEMLKPS